MLLGSIKVQMNLMDSWIGGFTPSYEKWVRSVSY